MNISDEARQAIGDVATYLANRQYNPTGLLISVSEAISSAEARGAERERSRCLEILNIENTHGDLEDLIYQIERQSPPDKDGYRK